jgi:Zn-dependent M28 family amino/carboxypeptidase
MAYLSLMDAQALAKHDVRRIRLTATGTMRDATSCNIMGELPGDAPGGNLIVVSGHLDSVVVGVGADDDASGVAAVLESARRLRSRRRKHTLRFIGFGAEEQLSVGSARYVTEQVEDLDRIAFACNFDSIGAPFGLSTVMSTGTPQLDAFVRDVLEDRQQFGRVQVDACPYQDQFWFTAKGIPGIWLNRHTHLGANWYHHSTHNDLAAVSMHQIAWTAETACELLCDLAASDRWPFPRDIAPPLREKIEAYRRELFDG